MSNRTRLSIQSQDWDMHSAPVGWVLPQALSAGTSKLFPLPRLLTQTCWLQQWMLSTSYTPQESGGRCQNSSALAWWVNCSLAAGVPYIATRTMPDSSLSSRNLVCILQDKSLMWDAVSRHKNAILVRTKCHTWSFHECGIMIYCTCMTFCIFCRQSMQKYSGFKNMNIFHKKNPQRLKEDMSLIHTVYGFFIQTAKKPLNLCWPNKKVRRKISLINFILFNVWLRMFQSIYQNHHWC